MRIQLIFPHHGLRGDVSGASSSTDGFKPPSNVPTPMKGHIFGVHTGPPLHITAAWSNNVTTIVGFSDFGAQISAVAQLGVLLLLVL